MRTMAQKRRRATVLKTGAAAVLLALIFTPKLDHIQLPDIGFPLISTAVAAPLE